ncbi:MAG: hypothetical protein QM778_22140 [Myxococcales bacterium]
MLAWLEQGLRTHLEVVFFLVLGLGHLLGRLSLGSFKLGPVTGTLLAGVGVGHFTGIALPTEIKECFFVLFLFSIGFRTGPQFFHGLRRDGLAYAGLAAVVAVMGLLSAFALSRLFGFDSGTGAGLLAGALTESAALGTAMDAINKLPVGAADRTAMANSVPVAFAVTYLIGLTSAGWLLARVGPVLMRIDLAEECRKLDEQMQGSSTPKMHARREFEMRAYALDPEASWVDQRLGALDLFAGEDRIFVESVRAKGLILAYDPSLILRTGDVVAVSGRRSAMVEVLEQKYRGLREVDDRELLSLSADLVDVIVTQPDVQGRTLAELGREESLRGVYLRRLVRGGQQLGMLPETQIERGDSLTLVGSAPDVARAAAIIGVTDRPTDSTDMLVVATAIVAGALVGLPTVNLGSLSVGLSLPVGVLLGGLVCGWLRSVRPAWFGRIPAPTLSVFESIGLTGFVAVVGLNAGPDFIRGLQTNGLSLVGAGVLTITISLVVGVLAGRWLFKLHPGLVLGVCAGGATATSALADVLQVAKSPVPSLGYGVAYAVGNVLLALWGTVIVAWLA